MSTRAILGIKNEDGTILGAWQWNDGKGLLATLNKMFSNIEKATMLINEGAWSVMFTQEEMEEYEDWLVNDLYQGRSNDVPYHSYTDVLGFKLLKHQHHENRAPVVYANFDEAIGQDINYLYLFDKSTNRWSVHS
jgi:hypothetical protein